MVQAVRSHEGRRAVSRRVGETGPRCAARKPHVCRTLIIPSRAVAAPHRLTGRRLGRRETSTAKIEGHSHAYPWTSSFPPSSPSASLPFRSSCTCAAAAGAACRRHPQIHRVGQTRRSANSMTCARLFDRSSTRGQLQERCPRTGNSVVTAFGLAMSLSVAAARPSAVDL